MLGGTEVKHEKKNKLTKADTLSETRAEHFPDTNLGHYRWPRHPLDANHCR
jgi:hypothetical protein